jgi:hypothetical protein
MNFAVVFLVSAIAAVNGFSSHTFIAAFCGGVFVLLPNRQKNSYLIDPVAMKKEKKEDRYSEGSLEVIPAQLVYRQQELSRIIAALLANGSILVVGEEGCGKSVLASFIAEKLVLDGFTVAFVQPATPKQMLIEIAYRLGIEIQNLEGKALSVDKLKNAIAFFLSKNTAVLIIDDASSCSLQFRMWLKELHRMKTPLLLFATDPPRSDIFFCLPSIRLKPLPEYAIREIMKQAAFERGLSLSHSQLASLQERAGGNPMFAQRAVEEEYLGLEVEGADHRRYLDITPFILLAGVGFVVMRSIGLGTNNQALYIFSSIAAALFLGVSRLFYNLPRESRRIR